MNTIVYHAENNTLQNLVEYIREYGSSFWTQPHRVCENDLPEKNGDVQLEVCGLQRKNIFPLRKRGAFKQHLQHSGAKNAWSLFGITGHHWLTIAVHDDGKGVYGQTHLAMA